MSRPRLPPSIDISTAAVRPAADEAAAGAGAPDCPEDGDSAFAPLAVEIVGGWPRHQGVERPIRAAIAALAIDPAVAPFLPAEAALALSTDAAVQALNRGWRGKDAPTNVLSFPTPPGTPVAPGIPPFVGDVVLALETLEREAAALDVPFHHHLQHLVVHGLLHLFGFDHEVDAMATEMEAIETRVLASLGVPDPYAAA